MDSVFTYSYFGWVVYFPYCCTGYSGYYICEEEIKKARCIKVEKYKKHHFLIKS
jgi:hypothetical protein